MKHLVTDPQSADDDLCCSLGRFTRYYMRLLEEDKWADQDLVSEHIPFRNAMLRKSRLVESLHLWKTDRQTTWHEDVEAWSPRSGLERQTRARGWAHWTILLNIPLQDLQVQKEPDCSSAGCKYIHT